MPQQTGGPSGPRAVGAAVGDDGLVLVDLVQVRAGKEPVSKHRAEGMLDGRTRRHGAFPDELGNIRSLRSPACSLWGTTECRASAAARTTRRARGWSQSRWPLASG